MTIRKKGNMINLFDIYSNESRVQEFACYLKEEQTMEFISLIGEESYEFERSGLPIYEDIPLLIVPILDSEAKLWVHPLVAVHFLCLKYPLYFFRVCKWAIFSKDLLKTDIESIKSQIDSLSLEQIKDDL